VSTAERLHRFSDDDDAMVGIVSLPEGDDGSPASTRPFVVILNAGLVHRVGPFGMSVQIARLLAGKGFRVLRFDQSGLGDSPPRTAIRDAGSIEGRFIDDGRAALDFLGERYGAKQFVVGGLCSGAMNAHRLCVADERVVGLYLLDGYAYATRTYYEERLVRRLRQPRTWLATAGRLAGRAADRVRTHLHGERDASPAKDGRDPRVSLFYQDWPPISDVRADLDRVLTRGVRMLFVYSGGWSNFTGVRQFDEMFPKLDGRKQVSVRYHEQADHTYMALEDRALLLGDLGEFVSEFDE
jgi:pimeloyl-ACP methyl ester carboxylesterase